MNAYRPLPLLFCLFTSLALVLSVQAGLWRTVDDQVFFTFNGTLVSHGTGWITFWAWTNSRRMDAVGALLLLGILWIYVRSSGPAVPYRAAQVITLILGSLLLIQGLHDIMLDNRRSPSQALLPFYSLSEMVPGVHPKVASNSSFPGDHASVLLLTTLCMWRLGGGRYGLAVLAIAVVFIPARLIGGAHWFSDIAAGAVSVTLIGYGLFFATPLGGWVTGRFLRLLEKPRLRKLLYAAALRPLP